MLDTVYECMLIFDSNRYAKDPAGVGSQVATMIEGLGGTVRASRLWNEQRLAYPIKGQRKGSYWLTYFSLDPEKITDFNRACRLNENVLRHLVLRIDPRLQETMIAHASGATTQMVEAARESTAGAKQPSRSTNTASDEDDSVDDSDD